MSPAAQIVSYRLTQEILDNIDELAAHPAIHPKGVLRADRDPSGHRAYIVRRALTLGLPMLSTVLDKAHKRRDQCLAGPTNRQPKPAPHRSA